MSSDEVERVKEFVAELEGRLACDELISPDDRQPLADALRALLLTAGYGTCPRNA